mmetsp:Transcript_266/g.2116  ORF Transcript_266/g.2116 Transcript_266/m.2116 type:complete len:91 (+) Transcript_266:1680-1952(+)
MGRFTTHARHELNQRYRQTGTLGSHWSGAELLEVCRRGTTRFEPMIGEKQQKNHTAKSWGERKTTTCFMMEKEHQTWTSLNRPQFRDQRR